jgi:ribosome biogenesis protein UTP30
MARTRALSKASKQEVTEQPLTTKVTHGTPYQLDPAQVERAAVALVAHMKKHKQEKEAAAEKKNLAADEDDVEGLDDPIFLNVSTKQHVHNTSRLKPTAWYAPRISEVFA